MSIGSGNIKIEGLNVKLSDELPKDNGFDSDDEENKQSKSLVIQSPDKVRKEKLKVRLMEESQ